MKIKVIQKSYEAVCALPPAAHSPPCRPSPLLRGLVRLLSGIFLRRSHFTFRTHGMEQLRQDTPCIILMNHSCFTDLMIAFRIFGSRPLQIVCTSDGFVGKPGLMRRLGCIPTEKFVTDFSLVKDIFYSVRELKTSVLMYPEASYSFDGTATPLPAGVGKLLKRLGVPVVLVRTYGAFHHDPLYNNLQHRRVDISAEVEYLLSPEELEQQSASEISQLLWERFSFDHFRWQQENHIKVCEPFRADHLNRVLYQCPHCLTEGKMAGKGITLRCGHCGKEYVLTEEGTLQAPDAAFTHIPDWYRWEREQVRQAILRGDYKLNVPVDICIMRDYRAIYAVGSGVLQHDSNGFHLTGCNGALDYRQKPAASYSLYADYYWYELGDVICIGKRGMLYYCFPKASGDVVAKTRLAAEELYRMEGKEPVRS